MAAQRTCSCGHTWTPAPGVPTPVICPVCGKDQRATVRSPITLRELRRVRRADNEADTQRYISSAPPQDHDLLVTISHQVSEAELQSAPDAEAPEAPSQMPASISRYQIRGELGRGGMGVVYRAYDPKFERDVAIKTLPKIEPDLLQKFKQEFRTLADLTHPNLATFYELGQDGQTWFFSMELVRGVDLLHYVRHGLGEDSGLEAEQAGPALSLLQLIRLRRSLAQLGLGLSALHGAGIIHRDIKPSNVLVTSDERVVLLDFGLAAELGASGQYQGEGEILEGTAQYMSPEQAAMESLTPASDWYSVGVMLYEALTERLPFNGSILQILLNKLETDPVPPLEIEPTVPEDLNELCRAVLRRSPTDRPSSSEILRRLNLAAARVETLSVTRPALQEGPQLVGREQHLALLESALAEMEVGRPETVFVCGRSGMGKSALIQEFLRQVRQRGPVVILTGRCYEQEAVPFKALDSLIDSLGRYLQLLAPAEAEAVIPQDWEALTRVFPVLGQVRVPAAAKRSALTIRDQQELRQRAIAALRELLIRIGELRPLVLYIDDLQWGDEDSASLLASLLRPPCPPLMLLIGTYRAEDANTSVFLNTFSEAQRKSEFRWNHRAVSVDPLTTAEAQTLAMALLPNEGPDVQRFAEVVAAESGGSPFFVQELVRHLLEAEDPTAEINLEDVLWTRVYRLPVPSRRLLEVIAVAGRPLPPWDSFRAAGVEADGPTLLAQLRSAHFVRSTGSSGEAQVETYHDRIREAVGRHLDVERRREVHTRLAGILEAALQVDCRRLSERLMVCRPGERLSICDEVLPRDWQRIFDLARHWDAAAQAERALPYALSAAERARSQYSLETAEQQFHIAERGLSSAAPETAYHLAAGLGEVLILRGRYEAAQRTIREARRLSPGNLARAEMEGKLGELAFKQGDLRAATDAVERALGYLGRRAARSKLRTWPQLLRAAAVQALHTLWPQWFLGKRSLEGSEGDLLAVRLLSRLAYAYWFTRSPTVALTPHLQALNLAELYPPTFELAQTYAEHAPGMSLIPYFSRALKYVEKSLHIRRQLGDVWGQAQSLHYHGIVLYAASRFQECIEKCEAAILLFEKYGDHWEINMCRYQLTASLYRLGRLREALAEARRIRKSGLELGDVQAAGLGLEMWTKALRGRVSPETVQAQLERLRGDDAQTASMVWQAEGVRRMAQGEYPGAAEAFERAYRVACQGGIQNTYIAPSLPWLVTALRRWAERLLPQDHPQARQLLHRAGWAVRRGLRLARRFQNDLPHMLREAALFEVHTTGSARKAQRLLDESLRVAEKQGARYEYALTLQARAELGLRFQWPEAESQQATAAAALKQLEDLTGQTLE